MDVGLPDMDGNEIARKIRIAEKQNNEHVPIIALTAHVDPEDKQQCIDAGMDAVLSKPLFKEKAADMIRAFVPKLTAQYVGLSSTSKHENKTIDLDYINCNFSYSKSVFKNILLDADECFAADIKEFREFYKKKDWLQLERLAHKMVGSSSYCGALRLKEFCHQLERALKENKNNTTISKLSKQVIEEYGKLTAAIKKILEK